MSLTKTPICDFGKQAENFKLKSTDGKFLTLEDLKGKNGTLIMFICNHCPYVIHYHGEIVKLSIDYNQKINMVAISSNDIIEYPQDSPERMKELWNSLNLSFPYLFDETQQIAKKYKAECTPEFYLFNKERALVYRGRLDSSSPGNSDEVDGSDLRKAIDLTLDNKDVKFDQFPSMGCNIKWK